MRGRRLILVAVLVLVLSVLLGACRAATPTPAPTPVATSTPTPAPKKLVASLGAEPPSLIFLDIVMEELEIYATAVYEPLVGRDKDMNPIPKLALRWEQLEPTRWRLYLRQGVKFHNGDDFTSEDVVATVNWTLKEKMVLLDYVKLKEAVAIDPYTVDLVLKFPDPIFLKTQLVLYIFPKAIARDNPDLAKGSGIGTGPYRFVRYARGDRIELASFDGYWGPKPQIKQATIVFRTEEAVRMAMVKAGEAQWAFPISADSAAGLPQNQTITKPALEFWLTRPNISYGAPESRDLADKRLRQAIAYSVDKEALVEKLTGGFGTPTSGFQPALPGIFGYNPDLPARTYDLEKAKALVKEAGAEGKEILFLSSSGRYMKDRETNEAIAYMMGQSGLKVNFKAPEYSEWLKYGLTNTPENREVMSDLWASSSDLGGVPTVENILGKYFHTGGVVNAVVDAKLDQLYKDALAEVDVAKREQKLKAIMAYNYEEVLVPVYFAPAKIWAVAPNLKWEPALDARAIIAEMRFTD